MKAISDISYQNNSKKIISFRKVKKNFLQEEAKKVLAYKKQMQSRPRVVDLRKKTLPATISPTRDYIVKIKPGSSKAKYILRPKKVFKLPNKISTPSAAPEIFLPKPEVIKIDKFIQKPKKRRWLPIFAIYSKKYSQKFVFSWRQIPFLIIAFLVMFSVKSFASLDSSLKVKKNKILGEVNIASQYLNSGKDSLLESDFSLASYKFKTAGERFLAAQKQINFLEKSTANLLKLFPGNEVSSSLNLLEAGGNISFAAEDLSQALLRFQNTQDIFASFKNKPKEENKISFTDALLDASKDLELANLKLTAAQKYLDKVDPNSLPSDKKQQVEEIKKTVPQLQESLDYFLSHLDILLEILGHNQPKKYILFFANSRELRPTGGFLGTYGLFDLNEGRIENLQIQSPYNVSGQLKEKYQAPEPLRLIQSKFNFHDANWFFDFPTSATKISLFHEKAGYPTADGIIVLTSNMMPEILEITGPISMPEYDAEITASNFFDVTQREVEIEYDKKLNEPKKFVADLFPKILERSFSLEKKDQTKILQIFLRELFAKNILIYFRDEKLEKMIQDWGFGGEVKNTKGDYLAVVSTNIGGGKTDQVIDQKTFHQTEILPDGRIIDTLTIERSHQGELNNYWTSIKNMDFMRIYVPQGSKLLEANGFDPQFFNSDILVPYEQDLVPEPDLEKIEKTKQIHRPSLTRIYQEGTKTVFGNWSGLEVGQKKTITLKYELPFRIKLKGEPALARYNLFVQRQSGTLPFSFVSDLYFPQKFSLLWKYTKNDNLEKSENRIHYETKLMQDRGYGVVFSEKIKN